MIDNVKKGDRVEFIAQDGDINVGTVLCRISGTQYFRIECDGHNVKVHETCIQSIIDNA